MGFAQKISTLILTLLSVALAFQSFGCGYTLQNSHSELMDKEGVRKVYVRPLINGTYKPGVENVVYNALIRTLLAHRSVKLVQNMVDADAVLEGNISVAEFGISGSTTANALPPAHPQFLPGSNIDTSQISVATIYTASLACQFVLNRTQNRPGKPKMIWNGSFSRAKPFPASNQLDVPGTTSALINESEFERALNEIASSMMDDVHESMLAMF